MLELLAPAGSMEAVTAAVQNGADAVYLGYGDFNARRNAKNFTGDEAAAAVSYCHLRGVKVFLTLNTLLTDRELAGAAQEAAQASAMGVDAVLVQDLGVLRMLRQTVPDLPVHASTQMTVHSLDGVKQCADLGMSRVVLSRELSRDQIEYICARSPVEIEVFAHGALCMCYSGQCFFSSVIGGRSGNRGLCAQPCRLKYGWGNKADGSPLSLKDMSLAGHLRELRKMGVACVKIEGRMKRPEYVAVVTGIYARAIREGREPTAEELEQLRSAFSHPRNVICPQRNRRVTIFVTPNRPGTNDDITQNIESLAHGFIESLEDKGITADIAVGFPANDLNGLAISLRSARDAMRLAGQLKLSGVISARSLTSEALLDLLPVGKREEFADRTLAGLEGRNDYEEMRDTFLGWCESPFASGEVAERLAMHRNSLQYRLKKIRALTGKDPWNFKDAFELWAAFVLKNISGGEKKQ